MPPVQPGQRVTQEEQDISLADVVILVNIYFSKLLCIKASLPIHFKRDEYSKQKFKVKFDYFICSHNLELFRKLN